MAKAKKEELTPLQKGRVVKDLIKKRRIVDATEKIRRYTSYNELVTYIPMSTIHLSLLFDQVIYEKDKELIKELVRLILKHQLIMGYIQNVDDIKYIHREELFSKLDLLAAYDTEDPTYTPCLNPEREQELEAFIVELHTLETTILQHIHDLAIATAQVIVQLVKEANRERQAPDELETHKAATETALAIAREKAHILGIEEIIFSRPSDVPALDYALTLLRTNHLPANFHTVPKEVVPTRLSLAPYLVREIKDTQKSSTPGITGKYKELLELALEKDKQADKNPKKNQEETVPLSKQEGIAAIKRPGSTHSDGVESGYGGSPKSQRREDQSWADWLGLTGVTTTLANMVTGNSPPTEKAK